MTALQLFAHMDGEALQVDELSAYYKTPGRLPVFAGNLKMRTAVRGRTRLPLLWS